MWFTIARIITALLMFWGLKENPAGYYTILNLVVFVVSGYGAYFSYRLKKRDWIWVFGIIALVYNPLIPFKLNIATWTVVDLICAVTVLVSLKSVK